MSKKGIKILGLVFFVALYLLTRVPRIGTTIVNTDEVYWHDRSERFLNAIKSGNFGETYQKYHPGVPLMWDFSISALLISSFTGLNTTSVFSLNNFVLLHTVTQIFLSSWFLILSLYLIYLIFKATDNWWFSLLSVTVLSLEPFYLGNSRLIHHDVQISLCILCGMVLVYLYSIKKWNLFSVILASFFLAIGALSKTLFFGALAFSFFGGAFFTLLNRGFKKMILFIFFLAFFFSLFYGLLFPAMIVNTKETVHRILTESYDVGEDEGHKQIFFGVETRDPGITFYPILIWLKTSPFMILGFFLSILFLGFDLISILGKHKRFELKHFPFLLFISIFYLGYFAVISYFSKKVDRYIVPLYPFFSLLCVLGYYRLFKLKKILLIIPTLLFMWSIVFPLYVLFPNYLVYTNPVFGDAKKSNEIIGQKLFGIGIFDLKDKIVKNYGDKMSIGINDYGPMLSIYPDGRVYNVLVEHPNSFKLMILGPNKDFPVAIVKDKNLKFNYVDSVYLNGLEFWRIYKKAY